jgi:hypothetical protein
VCCASAPLPSPRRYLAGDLGTAALAKCLEVNKSLTSLDLAYARARRHSRAGGGQGWWVGGERAAGTLLLLLLVVVVVARRV